MGRRLFLLLLVTKQLMRSNRNNSSTGVHIIVQKTPQVRFTLEGIQHQADYRFLDLDKIMIGSVAFKMLRFTPNELTSDQASVIMDQ